MMKFRHERTGAVIPVKKGTSLHKQVTELDAWTEVKPSGSGGRSGRGKPSRKGTDGGGDEPVSGASDAG